MSKVSVTGAGLPAWTGALTVPPSLSDHSPHLPFFLWDLLVEGFLSISNPDDRGLEDPGHLDRLECRYQMPDVPGQGSHLQLLRPQSFYWLLLSPSLPTVPGTGASGAQQAPIKVTGKMSVQVLSSQYDTDPDRPRPLLPLLLSPP